MIPRVLHPKSGRVLEVYTDQPGLQFNTANLLPNSDCIREVTMNIIIQLLQNNFIFEVSNTLQGIHFYYT